MIPIVTGILGAGLGAMQARKRKGTTPDLLQWAAVWGIIGALLGLFVAIALARLG